ncbi:MAG: hypothetical protein AB7I27_15335 [Bacteriovoracaceae bacterium]
MKCLMMILVLSFSFTASAQTIEATEAVMSFFKAKTYVGQTPQNKPCAVSFYKDQTAIKISASSAPLKLVKFVDFNSVYQWQPGQRYFLSSSKFKNAQGQEIEKTFMTRSVSDTEQYVVIEHRISVQDQTQSSQIECLFRL